MKLAGVAKCSYMRQPHSELIAGVPIAGAEADCNISRHSRLRLPASVPGVGAVTDLPFQVRAILRGSSEGHGAKLHWTGYRLGHRRTNEHGRRGRGRALGDVRPLNGPGATFPFASVACVKAGFTPFRKAAHPTHRPKGASGEDGHLELKSSQPNLRSGGPPRSADLRKGLLPVTRPAAGV